MLPRENGERQVMWTMGAKSLHLSPPYQVYPSPSTSLHLYMLHIDLHTPIINFLGLTSLIVAQFQITQ